MCKPGKENGHNLTPFQQKDCRTDVNLIGNGRITGSTVYGGPPPTASRLLPQTPTSRQDELSPPMWAGDSVHPSQISPASNDHINIQNTKMRVSFPPLPLSLLGPLFKAVQASWGKGAHRHASFPPDSGPCSDKQGFLHVRRALLLYQDMRTAVPRGLNFYIIRLGKVSRFHG